MRLRVLVVTVGALAATFAASAALQGQTPGVRFTTLPGFKIERVVPLDKVDSYIVLTFDSRGRLVVSKENDSPRLLVDGDNDGVLESERVLTDKVRNCQGLWFDGRTLYGNCAPVDGAPDAPAAGSGGGGGRSGLFRMEDPDGDDVYDDVEQLNTFQGGIQEHGPHAIRRGPDGHPYIMLGNNTAVPDELISAATPLAQRKERQFLPAMPDGRGFGPSAREGLHGTLFRYDREKKQYVIFISGLRNAYDHAFNLAGEAFTYDSDMEWDLNLPWYRDVRSVHGIQLGDYGYRNGSGKLPPYDLDSLPPLRDVGRGSPVGTEFYHHTVYPKQFHDAYFEADWSRGRLLWTPLIPDGATYKTRADRAEFVHGEPLNITDLEVAPDGMLYFSTGGRGTDGGVYRVRYVSARRPVEAKGLLAIVRQPQPLSSWGYAALETFRASMGETWGGELEKLARDAGAGGDDRAQAIHMLQRHGPQPGADLLRALIADKDVKVRAAAVYVAGQHATDDAKAIAAGALKDADPVVRRRALEALVRQGLAAGQPAFAPVADIAALLNDADRFVRYAARVALERTPREDWGDRILTDTNPLGAIEGMVALVNTARDRADLEPVFEKQLALMPQRDLSADTRLRLLRAFQLAAIEARDAVSPELRRKVHDLLVGEFPSKDDRLSRELASTLAYCSQPEAIAKILAAIPPGDASQPLQIHYVYALRTIKDGWTRAQKAQLTEWFARSAEWRGGASFPGSINLLFDAALTFFDDEEKTIALQKVPKFAPLTDEEIAAAAAAQARQRQQFAAQAAPGGQAGVAGQAAPAPQANAGGRGDQGAAAGGGFGRRPGAPASARSRGVRALSREEILEYQLYVPVRQAPSVAAGRATFDKACGSCHRFGSLGTEVGPDLTTINSRFKKKDVLEAILWPSKVISDQYESTIIETKDGEFINGLVVKEDALRVQIKTATAAERPIVIQKSRIEERRKSKTSIMPEALIDDFSQQEIANLLAFLRAGPPRGAGAKVTNQ